MIYLRYRSRNVSVGFDEAYCTGRVLVVDATSALGRRSFSAAAFPVVLFACYGSLNECK